MPVKETGGPRVTRAVGVDQIRDHHWRDAMKGAALGQPGAILADFNRRQDPEAGKPAGEHRVIGIAVLE